MCELEIVSDSKMAVFCSALLPMNSLFAVAVPMLVVVGAVVVVKSKGSVAAAFVLESEKMVELDESMKAVFELHSEIDSMYLKVVVAEFAVGFARPKLVVVVAVVGLEVESKVTEDAVERLSKVVLVEILVVVVGPRMAGLGADLDLGTNSQTAVLDLDFGPMRVGVVIEMELLPMYSFETETGIDVGVDFVSTKTAGPVTVFEQMMMVALLIGLEIVSPKLAASVTDSGQGLVTEH